MAVITFGGKPTKTSGELPKVGSKAPDFRLSSLDLSSKKLKDYSGKKVIMNIFPSVGTGVCATSVRKFNEKASSLDNTVVLCISRDLPFAQKEFCAVQGLENVEMLSDYRDQSFGNNYGVNMLENAFEGLLARSIIVLDENGKVIYNELVPEIGQEPNYDAALKALQ
ncbi:thiol peroxidase [Aureisphaera sp. CAU 1614]|uniref:Thiol peroxidase n=1 Tax=Halomarinibacterium sedimenti TaxID=2857106 RepID=A0A9X1FNQ7_9FLAO|nr:thiol peroxidase [Halomarinibacterium sedimenti]MBW2937806.1 thiol peroxidase [Halomarinibacterium sedimenti]